MDTEDFTVVVCTAGLIGMLGGMILIAYEDGVPQGRLKKILCRMGRHKTYIGKVAKYYCQHCKKPREHPALKVIDGGNKMGNNKFYF
jgi:hypothetical protein